MNGSDKTGSDYGYIQHKPKSADAFAASGKERCPKFSETTRSFISLMETINN
jgi:hypothetical protein